jgi:hypothetical protein
MFVKGYNGGVLSVSGEMNSASFLQNCSISFCHATGGSGGVLHLVTYALV